jgi:uncharacterized protein HemX
MAEQTPNASDPSQNAASREQQRDPAENKSTLSEHKGKLAIGVAATLGLIVFYKWRERRLAKEDPEAFARLQKLKASVRHEEPNAANAQGGSTAPYTPDREGQQADVKTQAK